MRLSGGSGIDRFPQEKRRDERQEAKEGRDEEVGAINQPFHERDAQDLQIFVQALHG